MRFPLEGKRGLHPSKSYDGMRLLHRPSIIHSTHYLQWPVHDELAFLSLKKILIWPTIAACTVFRGVNHSNPRTSNENGFVWLNLSRRVLSAWAPIIGVTNHWICSKGITSSRNGVQICILYLRWGLTTTLFSAINTSFLRVLANLSPKSSSLALFPVSLPCLVHL